MVGTLLLQERLLLQYDAIMQNMNLAIIIRLSQRMKRCFGPQRYWRLIIWKRQVLCRV